MQMNLMVDKGWKGGGGGGGGGDALSRGINTIFHQPGKPPLLLRNSIKEARMKTLISGVWDELLRSPTLSRWHR